MCGIRKQSAKNGGPAGSRSTAVTALILAGIVRAAAAPAAEPLTGDRLEVAREFADPYRLSNKPFARDPDPQRAQALAASSDARAAALGTLLVERNELRSDIKEANAKLQSQFTTSVKGIQHEMFGFLAGQLLGGGTSLPEQAQELTERIREPVAEVLKAQIALFNSSVKEMKLEREIREQLRSLRGLVVPDTGADNEIQVAFRLDSKRHQFAAMGIKNRRARTLHNVMVFVESDCKYDSNGGKDELNVLGAAMLKALGVEWNDVVGMTARYVARDRAQEAFEDSDKGYYVFLDAWEPGAMLEMDVQGVLSFVRYVRSVKLTILSDESSLVDHELPVDTAKKKLVADMKGEYERQQRAAKKNKARQMQEAKKQQKKAQAARRKRK